MNNAQLLDAAERYGTPAYVYDLDEAVARARLLTSLFEHRFGLSFAIKSNPNAAVLAALAPECATLDASSFAEVLRALAIGVPAARVSFSGPAKRRQEIDGALALGIGELVIESPEEARVTSALAVAMGRRQPCLVRINPARVPRKFGASMAGTPSQFGIDEEDIDPALREIAALPGLDLLGFHIYSGTNSLDADAIAENFQIFAEIFAAAQALTGIEVRRLIFGSGFGVPYLPSERPLEHARLPALVNPIVDALRARSAFANAECTLELGRWIIAPCGWLLTRVVSAKTSRGTHIRACDAGFNNHLAACGMMGSVFRRNWVIRNLSSQAQDTARYLLVGPLCTTIDRLAADIELPTTEVGDVLAIDGSGAYGLTASPTRFISHPEPAEVAWHDGAFLDCTESRLNHWPTANTP